MARASAGLGRMPSRLDILCLLAHRRGMATTSHDRLVNRLRVGRAERDLSQEQLAQAAGVSRQTISSIETGQYCPSTLLAFRLARVLQVRVDELFWLEGED
jgi:putative transcriptional regulator